MDLDMIIKNKKNKGHPLYLNGKQSEKCYYYIK